MSLKDDLIRHLRALPDDDAAIAELDAAVRGVKLPYAKGAPKPVMKKSAEPPLVEGKPNVAYLIDIRAKREEYNADWRNYYGNDSPGFQEAMDRNLEEMKALGLDLSKFAPLSESDIVSVDSVLESTDVQLDVLAKRLEQTENLGLRNIDIVKKKSWARVLRKAASLQRLCRERLPAAIKRRKDPKVHEVWSYTHAIRYFLWTMRSTLNQDDGQETFPQVMEYLVEAAMTISVARTHASTHRIAGALIQIAPRHGKTMLAIADCALEICLRPWRVHGVVHNKQEFAAERFMAIRNHFDDSMPEGRRRRTLFPGLDITAASLRGKSKMVLMQDGVRTCIHEEGNLTPRGTHGRATGMTFHEILFDDPSDEKEQNEAGTRERTNNALSQTWMRRLTGKDSFFVYICTSWHPQDFASILKQLGREGRLNIAYFAQACGGPEHDFAPLWPENPGVDAVKLKEAYYTLGPAKYACVFQNDPDSKDSKRIQRLHYFDSKILKQWQGGKVEDENWARFFATAKFYVSVDPSGTASRYSNLAGITYCAFGLLRETNPQGITYEMPKVVFLQYWSMPGSQHMITQEIYNHSRRPRGDAGPYPVDIVLVEAGGGGFHATADDLVKNHGFPANKVVKRSPGTGTKVERLVQYAIHIENGDVMFPGEWGKDEHGDSALRIHKNWQPMAEQIIRAGSMNEDNLLDCVRQQLSELSHEIFARKGIVKDHGAAPRVSAQRQRMIDYYERTMKPKSANRGQPTNAAFISRKMITCN